MASFAFASRPHVVESFGSRMLRAMALPFALLSSRHDARVKSEFLSRMSDWQLDDIGVTRGEIDHLAFSRERTR